MGIDNFASRQFPVDWEITSLGAIADVIDPQPDHRRPELVDDGYPYIGLADIEPDGSIDILHSKKVSMETINKQRLSFQIGAGDIVFGKIGTVGSPQFLPTDTVPYALNTSVVLIKPKINPRFVLACLESSLFSKQMYSGLRTTSQPRLGIQQIRSLLVPRPPPAEQRKIAAILSTWDEAITLTEQLIALLEAQLKALAQNLVPEAGDLPSGWHWGRLSDFLEQFREYVNSLEDKLYPRISVKWWAKGAVVAGFDNGVDVKMQRHQLAKHGQIIVSEIWAKHGSIGIIPPDGEGALITSHFYLFEPKNQNESHYEYIQRLVEANYFMKQADTTSAGSTGYASIRAKDFLAFKLPIPPIDLQRTISNALSTSQEQLRLFENYCELLKSQKRGLMQQLLTGEIRVQVEDEA